MVTIQGQCGIKATVLAHSITQAGKEIITWEIEYPRLILAELNTHRQLSRNSFSSRAVPFLKMLEQLTGEPVRFGENQGGMQDKGQDFDAYVWLDIYNEQDKMFHNTPFKPRTAWKVVRDAVVKLVQPFVDAGYHKQVYNRLLEAWQMQKTVLSATEVDNFFWLRDDEMADPTIAELAKVMRQAKELSAPEVLEPGEWHLPYVQWIREQGRQVFLMESEAGADIPITLEQAIKVSCARCAAVSYRNEGYGLEKSLELYDRLVGSEKKHASALEHCATPMKDKYIDEHVFVNCVNVPRWPDVWEPGITHMDRNLQLWSGNFCGWIQYRKLIPGECYSK